MFLSVLPNTKKNFFFYLPAIEPGRCRPAAILVISFLFTEFELMYVSLYQQCSRLSSRLRCMLCCVLFSV